MCRNSNRRFSGRNEALRHAELHLAGLIVSAGEEDRRRIVTPPAAASLLTTTVPAPMRSTTVT